jgi:predicted O-linked N-acetylglucosamine transferase (SPINDLY family)
MAAGIDTAPAASAADLHLGRGEALRAAGKPLEAVAEFQAALELEPNLAEAHHQLGNAWKSLRRFREAAASLRAAALLEPRNAVVWLNLGVACLELRRHAEAVDCFARAIRIEPRRPEAHNILGHGLLCLGRCEDAKRALGEALRLRPGYPAAHDNLGRVLKAQGRSAEALAQHRAALEGRPNPATHSNLLYSLNFPADIAPGDIAAEHFQWAERYAEPLRAAWKPRPRRADPSRPLRVGYVSPDLIHHSVAYFLEPVLAAHDGERFEVTCYSDAALPDAFTARLRSLCGRWRDIAGESDERVADIVREDGIDILVDLAGHTAHNRLLVFARKPAPVQVTWLGYPNTTGLRSIDYRLTEAVSDPPGLTEPWHSEELFRLPGPFSCYGPPAESPAVAPLPALRSRSVTFGCFNHLAKVTPAMIALWSRILAEAEDSRLYLRSRGLSDRETSARIRAGFAENGVNPNRVELDGSELSVADHLGAYRKVDIGLDTFPYNGTTTTCEALWMGVPVVTLAGRTHVSRVGVSLLTHLGSPEWAASTPDDYVRRCLDLAADLPRLAAIREGLRERLRSGPLCDGPGFTRRLEEAFQAMWRRKCEGPGPEPGPC